MTADIAVSIQSPSSIPEKPTSELVFEFTRTETDEALAVAFELSGEARYDLDYTTKSSPAGHLWLPESPAGETVIGTVHFDAGQSTVTLLVSPRTDNLVERNETVVVSVLDVDPFGSVNGSAARIVRRQETVFFLVDDANRLATVDVETGLIDVLGTIDASQIITDIAFLDDGSLIALSWDHLYRLEPDNLSDGIVPTEFLGAHSIIQANALIDSRDDDFGSDQHDLFAVGQGALDLQRIDLETDGNQYWINNVVTVYDIDGNLAQRQYPSHFVSSGDLDYTSAGHLLLTATGVADTFDSLIEIQTPGTSGVINNAPKPAEDPGETFDLVYGLALDGVDNFAFAGHVLLEVNPFSRDVSRLLEMTGRPYTRSASDSATGIILGTPVAPPVVQLNTSLTNPAHLPRGTQPTSWTRQRSELRSIEVQLGASLSTAPVTAITLENLGVSGFESPQTVVLRDEQVELSSDGKSLTLRLDPQQLANGRYRLTLAPEITTGETFSWVGDRSNRFFVLRGDWDGNAIVDLRDLQTLDYWFESDTPAYVDLDQSGNVDAGDLPLFASHFASVIALPGTPPMVDPSWTDTNALKRALETIRQPLDVNGNQSVSPLDALNVINRIASGNATVTDWQYDTNADGRISPLDALRVINAIARGEVAREIGFGERVSGELAAERSSPHSEQDILSPLDASQIDQWMSSLG